MPNHKTQLDEFYTFPKISDPLGALKFISKIPSLKDPIYSVELTAKLDGEYIGIVFAKDYEKSVTRARVVTDEDPFSKEYIKDTEKMALFEKINGVIRKNYPGSEKILISTEYCYKPQKTPVMGCFIFAIKIKQGQEEIYCDMKLIRNEMGEEDSSSLEENNIYFVQQFGSKIIDVTKESLEDLHNFYLTGIKSQLKKGKELHEELQQFTQCPVAAAFGLSNVSSEGFVAQIKCVRDVKGTD